MNIPLKAPAIIINNITVILMNNNILFINSDLLWPIKVTTEKKRMLQLLLKYIPLTGIK